MCNFCAMYDELEADRKNRKFMANMPQVQIKHKLKTTIKYQLYVRSDDKTRYNFVGEDTFGTYNINFCPVCGKDLRGNEKRRKDDNIKRH